LDDLPKLAKLLDRPFEKANEEFAQAAIFQPSEKALVGPKIFICFSSRYHKKARSGAVTAYSQHMVHTQNFECYPKKEIIQACSQALLLDFILLVIVEISYLESKMN
jgi:hypothetical protein